MVCNKCGCEFESAFCPDCGAAKQEASGQQQVAQSEQVCIKCIQCGKEIDSMFCPDCGGAAARVDGNQRIMIRPEERKSVEQTPVYKKNKTKAIVALVCGLISMIGYHLPILGPSRLIIMPIVAIFGLALGISMRKIKEGPLLSAAISIGIYSSSVTLIRFIIRLLTWLTS